MSKQNLTRIVGIWWVMVLMWLITVSIAQDLQLEPDTPITVTIGDYPAWLTYTGITGEVITLSTMTAITDTAPDTTLEILYPDRHRLEYVDDVVFPDGTVKSDAVIDKIELPVEGVYRIRVDSFNGVSEGEVEVLLTHSTESYNVITTDTLTIVSGEIENALTYSLDVEPNTPLTIVARDISGTLDPVLSIYDAAGTLLAFNDDHQSGDLSLDVFDAQVAELVIEDRTTLEIIVKDFLGRTGTVELIISS